MTYIYSTSKHRRSGSTMQKLKGRGDTKRYMSVRAVRDGFPVTRPFATEDEVIAYTEQPEIVCLLCGKPCASLALHLHRTHDMDGGDYRLRYGIPFKFSLAGTTLRERRRAIGLSQANQATIAAMLEKKRARDAVNAPKARPRVVPIVREKMSAIIAAVQHHPRYDDGLFDWHMGIAATVFHCRKVAPPDGVPSWSTFKKRMAKSADLRRRFHEARAARPRFTRP